MYGFSGALLTRYTRAKKFATDNNSVMSKIDPSLYGKSTLTWYNTKQVVVGSMANHMDDFLYTSDNGFIKSFISLISRRQIVLSIWD